MENADNADVQMANLRIIFTWKSTFYLANTQLNLIHNQYNLIIIVISKNF